MTNLARDPSIRETGTSSRFVAPYGRGESGREAIQESKHGHLLLLKLVTLGKLGNLLILGKILIEQRVSGGENLAPKARIFFTWNSTKRSEAESGRPG